MKLLVVAAVLVFIVVLTWGLSFGVSFVVVVV
jgi:hypothetical protein